MPEQYHSLAPHDEEKVRTMYEKNAYTKCNESMKQFAACAQGRTLSVAWACTQEKRVMKECLRQYLTPQHLDDARESYVRSTRQST